MRGLRTRFADAASVAEAFRLRLPIPGLAASLAWFDALTTARGSASLSQAQRDDFGRHTDERVDAPGVVVHSEWAPADGPGAGR